jgi:hypothetical protein
MILGECWDAFCHAFNAAGSHDMKTQICLTIDPGLLSKQTGYKAPVDDRFITKTRDTLLQSFRSHIRCLKHLTVDGPMESGASKAIQKEVAMVPWIDDPDWPAKLDNQSRIAKELQNQNRFMEASTVWSEILYSMRFKERRGSSHPLSTGYNPILTYSLKNARCYLHYLESPPADLQDEFFKKLGEYTKTLMEASTGGYPPMQRPEMLFVYGRMCRLVEARIPHSYSASRICSLMRRAHSLDPENDDIAQELANCEEWKNSIRLTIRCIWEA